MAAVVLATAVIGLLTDEGQQPLGRRSLRDWVADVNQACAASRPRIEAASERDDAARGSGSIKERLPGLKDLEAAHSDLYKEVSGIELPSDPNDNGKAQDWLNTYGVRRDRLAGFVDLIDELPHPIGATEALNAINIGQAAQGYVEATTAATRKNETLGISCP